MKKYFLATAFLFFVFNAYSQSDSTVFDIYNSFFAQTYSHSGCGYDNDGNGGAYRRDIPAGGYPQTIFGYQWQGVSGNPGAAYYGKNPMLLSGLYSPTGGWHKTQDSFTINYPFTAGYKYDIYINCYMNDGDPNYGDHPAKLQLQLTNTPDYTYGRNCLSDPDNFTTPVYNLLNTTNPALEFQAPLENTTYNHNFSFTPTTSYSYVWLLAKTNETYENYGNVYISKIVIYKTLNVAIGGPGLFCLGTSNTYQLNLLGGGTFTGSGVTWTATGNISIVGSNTGNSVSVTSGTLGTTSGDLTATIGTSSITQHILVGLQPLNVTANVDRSSQPSGYQYLTASTVLLPNTVSSNYNWYLENNGVRGNLIASGTSLTSYPIPPGTTIFYRCEVTTPCGLELAREVAYNTNNGANSLAAKSIVVYPNPSSSEMNVAINDSQAQQTDQNLVQQSPVDYQVILYNSKGKILKSGKTKNGNANIPVADVPNGIYYLHILNGDDKIEKQIIIQH